MTLPDRSERPGAASETRQMSEHARIVHSESAVSGRTFVVVLAVAIALLLFALTR